MFSCEYADNEIPSITGIPEDLDLYCKDIRDVCGIYFCNNTNIVSNIVYTNQNILSISGALSLSSGSSANPIINFGNNQHNDYASGIFSLEGDDGSIINDNICFSLDSIQTVGIFSRDINSDNSQHPEFIKGLNIGTKDNIAGIRRVCSDISYSWEDGHLGNSEELIFTPADFQRYGSSPGNYYMDSGPLNMEEPFNPILGVTDISDISLVAMKLIPKGFEINSSKHQAVINIGKNGGGTPATPSNVSNLYIYSQNATNPLDMNNLINNSMYTLGQSVTLTHSTKGTGNNYIIIILNPQLQLTTIDMGLLSATITMGRY